jgi:hypothetical protein
VSRTTGLVRERTNLVDEVGVVVHQTEERGSPGALTIARAFGDRSIHVLQGHRTRAGRRCQTGGEHVIYAQLGLGAATPADVSDRAPKCAIVRGVVTESSEAYELSNVVETALARALVLAAEAKRWDVVAQIAEELRRRGSAHHTRASWPRERRHGHSRRRGAARS